MNSLYCFYKFSTSITLLKFKKKKKDDPKVDGCVVEQTGLGVENKNLYLDI